MAQLFWDSSNNLAFDTPGLTWDAFVPERKPMAKIKLNIRTLNAAARYAYGQQIIAALTGNANFPTPGAVLTGFTTANTGLNTRLTSALTARQASQQATTELTEANLDWEAKIGLLANYVELTAEGDTPKIQSAGFDVRGPVAPVGPLPAPANLAATMGDMAGEIDLQWDALNGANSYIVQQNTDPNNAAGWTQTCVSTNSSCSATGLTSGTVYYFRICAVGAAGQGPWSDVAQKMAP
ncbi:MAG: fibronectin type III domain-containing protein [Verrucomicrobia bacterium]|nr:fibronectin type III domain-containing protein [Verrucomicrobiota bacterium]